MKITRQEVFSSVRMKVARVMGKIRPQDVPLEIEIKDNMIRDYQEIISEIFSIGWDEGENSFADLVETSIFHPPLKFNPVTVEGLDYHIFEYKSYWSDREMEDVIRTRLEIFDHLEEINAINLLKYPIMGIAEIEYATFQTENVSLSTQIDYLLTIKDLIDSYTPKQPGKNYSKDNKKLFVSSHSFYKLNNITLNLENATLAFKNKEIEISPSTSPIRLLELLIINAGKIVEYKDIGRHLGMNCYYPGITNKDIARDIQFIKNDLVNILSLVGMEKNNINRFITTKTGLGYILNL